VDERDSNDGRKGDADEAAPALPCGLPTSFQFVADGEVVLLSLKNCGERDLAIDSIAYCAKADLGSEECLPDSQIEIGPIVGLGSQELVPGDSLDIPLTYSADGRAHQGDLVIQTNVATLKVEVSAPAL
jgi:hypothetical protein